MLLEGQIVADPITTLTAQYFGSLYCEIIAYGMSLLNLITTTSRPPDSFVYF